MLRLAEPEGVATVWTSWVGSILPSQRLGTGCDPQRGGFDLGDGWCDGRTSAFVLSNLMAARAWEDRLGVKAGQLDGAIRAAVAFLLRRQHADGRLDLGGMYSPNEVGFTLPGLVEGYRRLAALPADPFGDLLDDLELFLRRGADAVLKGEAFTANHRWAAACAPLAAVHSLWPDDRYIAKVDAYLADGIDCDDDGCWYEERSPNYNMVANHGLIVTADALDRPELFDPVVRSFEFLMHLIQPNGEVDASFSHRLDRGQPGASACSYGVARRAAQVSGDGRITTLANQAWSREQSPLSELMPLLFQLDRSPAPMPEPATLSTTYERCFRGIGVARVRRGETSLTLAADSGGHFYDTVRDQWGGPHRSDDWIHLHHGELVVQSIHLAGAGMANIQPETLAWTSPGQYRLTGRVDGWVHTLHFRPGSPEIDMPWEWAHEVDVEWQRDDLRLALRSNTPESLLSSLIFLVRPGATVREPDSSPTPRLLVAGETIALCGGGPIHLESGDRSIVISGLPEARHERGICHAPPIPSAIAQQCGRLTIGLEFPMHLDLRLHLGRECSG